MKMKQLQNLMREAQKMQARMEEEIAQLVVRASSGGGMVQVEMGGDKSLKSLTIDAEAVDPEDVEMLQDLILAAVNEACRKVDEELKSRMGGMTSGLLGQF